MEVKEAVHVAKQFISDLLKDEGIINVGLEEIDFDLNEDVWKVTLGFSRAWNTKKSALSTISGEQPFKRAYRIITIDNNSGKVKSIKRTDALVD